MPDHNDRIVLMADDDTEDCMLAAKLLSKVKHGKCNHKNPGES